MRGIACALVLIAASTASAQEAVEYRSLRASRPDGRSIPVKDLALVRDAYRINLHSGVVHLLAPVGRQTVGAVFIGDGSYQLTPATAAERRHLQLVSGSTEVLSDRFKRLVLLFTDRTADELLAHAPAVTGTPDQAATRAYEEYLQRDQTGGLPNFHLRLLADLLNRPARKDGVFLAFVEGQSYPQVLLAVDPLGVSNLTPRFSFFGGEEVALVSFDRTNGGLWYSSTFAEQAARGHGKPIRLLADAGHYEIETTLDGTALRGRTTITFAPTADGLRVLPIQLFHKLRIQSATLERGDTGARTAVTVLQEEHPTSLFAKLFGEEPSDADVAVQFSEPLSRGVEVRLTLTYDGRDVLDGANGIYSVGARDSWYPNLGTFDALATYAMTFRYPSKNVLVAVGEQVSEKTDGGQKVAVWRSDVPIRVAGFNYGDYQKTSKDDADSGVDTAVYTHRGTASGSMANNAMADALNTARLGKVYFGAPPYRHLSVTQQPELNFGQSWPTLVFLPTTSFISSTDLALGTDGIDPRALQSLKEFRNTVAWHEVAHQWWGHQVGWASYRDQWLSEGIAEFTAGLALEITGGGHKGANAYWELRRIAVLGKTTGVANVDAGPITQGFRLTTRRSPRAAQAIIYDKGAYVVHMLRMVMRQDGVPDPDHAFKAMMMDFVKTWSGKNPSTADFQAVAERHLTPDLDLAGDGRLDYFFNQWVYGTDVPALTSAIEATDLGGGKYRIAGTVTQAGVPAEFHTRVPIYIDFGNDRVGRLGTIAVTGSTTAKVSVEVNLPQRPRHVLINAMHDVLSR
jgi:peptidase M1-like protein